MTSKIVWAVLGAILGALTAIAIGVSWAVLVGPITLSLPAFMLGGAIFAVVVKSR